MDTQDYTARCQPVRVGGRVVGAVEGEVFRKRVVGSRHFLRKPPAIGFDLSSLWQAEQAGAKRVEVTDTETGRVYAAPIGTIRSEGLRVNRGFGEQIALPLAQWQTSGGQPA